jgi:hypothetical protein
MNAGELIEKLQQIDPDTAVGIEDGEFGVDIERLSVYLYAPGKCPDSSCDDDTAVALLTRYGGHDHAEEL